MRNPLKAGLILTAAAVGCSDPTSAIAVGQLNVVQDSIHVAVGASSALEVKVSGPRGEDLPDRISRVEWSVDDPAVASVQPTATGATVTALSLGETRVRADLAGLGNAAAVYVYPTGLASIDIEPDSLVVTSSKRPEARALLLAADGSELAPDGFRLSWRIGNALVAQLASSATLPTVTLARTTQGRTELILIVNGMKTSVPVTAIADG